MSEEVSSIIGSRAAGSDPVDEGVRYRVFPLRGCDDSLNLQKQHSERVALIIEFTLADERKRGYVHC